jgi:hypothetical protein
MDKTNSILLITIVISVVLTAVLLYDMFSDKRWEESHPLTWNDFRGIPNPLIPYNALIKSHLDYQVAYDWETVQGSCRYWVTEIKGIAYMSKVGSFAKEEGKNDVILNHEQGHFDIVQTFANRFTERAEAALLDKKFLCPSNDSWQISNEVNQKLDTILYQINGGINPMQEDYDSETNHGLYYDGQRKWDSTIKNLLN